MYNVFDIYLKITFSIVNTPPPKNDNHTYFKTENNYSKIIVIIILSFWDLPSLYPLLKIVFQKKSLITGFTVTVAIRQNYKKKKKQRKLALSRNAGKISYILRTYHFIMLEKKTHFDKV